MTEFCALRYRGRFIVTTATRPMVRYVTTSSADVAIGDLFLADRRQPPACAADAEAAERLPLIGRGADHTSTTRASMPAEPAHLRRQCSPRISEDHPPRSLA